MKKNFDINVAINLNAGELINEDFMGNTYPASSIKEAAQLSQDPGFLFGYCYPEWISFLTLEKQYTKEEYKKASSSYRKYVRESNSVEIL